ncbi:MAG: butyrate kinase [Chlorobi bacterium]|nr:butyrate kinase [Chlorobiota bacterium]
MTENEAVIVINPGSTTTKFALFNRSGSVYSDVIQHHQDVLDQYDLVTEQLYFRHEIIFPVIKRKIEELELKIKGVVGRGGIVKPLEGGTYRVNEDFLEDVRSCRYGNHASNLGTLLASRIARELGVDQVFTVDPVTVDNMWDKARISGVPGIERVCRGHPLNVKRTAREVAKKQGIKYTKARYVVAHLGGGFSITALKGGKIVDVNDGLLGMGPFSPNRAGALPLRGVIRLCYAKPENEVIRLFSNNSGLKGYLGEEDLRRVLDRVNQGEQQATHVYHAFVYQIAKEIGACHIALRCRIDGIIITGGIAHSDQFIRNLKSYIEPLATIFVMPGEFEMEALAEGAWRVLDGREKAGIYKREP